MGCLTRIITLVFLLISINGHAEGNSDEDAAELEEVEGIMRIRINSGKGPFADMDEYINELARKWTEKENPGAEIDEASEEFLLAKEKMRIYVETATGPNYASLFTRPGTAEKFKDMIEKYDHLREYKGEL